MSHTAYDRVTIGPSKPVSSIVCPSSFEFPISTTSTIHGLQPQGPLTAISVYINSYTTTPPINVELIKTVGRM